MKNYNTFLLTEKEKRKRYNDVSVWINKATEKDMKLAGFEFDDAGNCPLYYKGKEVGYLSNFNGVLLNDEYVDALIPLFKSFSGTGIWNYRDWKKHAKALGADIPDHIITADDINI
jgi:hypothetical protein